VGLKDKLERAKFAFKDEIFSVNGPLNMERDKLIEELLSAARTQAQKEGAGDQRINVNPVLAIKKQIAALEDRMRDDFVTIRFTAVNKGEWGKWIIQNPPRKNNDIDRAYGFNTDKFFEHALRASATYVDDPGTLEAEWEDAVTEPIDDEDWDRLVEAMTAGDWDRAQMTVLQLNQKQGQQGADFLRNGSLSTDDSEPTPDSPATSE